MNLLYLILFAIGIFMCSLIGYKKYFSTALYALAIGGVVNSNFFTAISHPIDVFGLPFGIDSIIYTLFIFCVIFMYFRFGKKDAFVLSISSVVAIILTAFFELTANLFSGNNTIEIWHKFMLFFFSALATIIATLLTIELLSIIEKHKKVNRYLLMVFAIVLSSIVNSSIYYLLSGFTAELKVNEIFTLILTSLIGKTIGLMCSLLMMFIINSIDKKIENKQEKNNP